MGHRYGSSSHPRLRTSRRTDPCTCTAGQERFRSISRLYYRGANACILCYSITEAQSFAEMGMWLTELRRNLPSDIVLHVVGTKADIVAREPSKREVPFERCIAYVAENLAPGKGSTPPPTAATPMGMPGYHSGDTHHQHHVRGGAAMSGGSAGSAGVVEPQSTEPRSPSSKRSSGFWGQEVGWDACHEISAESGEGVEEVFRVVTRKLVEQNRKMQQALLAATATPGVTPFLHPDLGGFAPAAGGGSGEAQGYFDGVHYRPGGSFKVGRDRRSWLFSPGFNIPTPAISGVAVDAPGGERVDDNAAIGRDRRRCC